MSQSAVENVQPSAPSSDPAKVEGQPVDIPRPRQLEAPEATWVDKAEAFVSRLSTRDNFWHSICSFIWLPLAFFSGIRTRKIDTDTYAAYLPFRRFNRNWYRAMAGGALLGNAEIAGGMYVFGICGSDYTVVCKNLNYTFLRPCMGPAVYRMKPREDLRALVKGGGEFNCKLDMEIMQQPLWKQDRERRVGKCEVTFHVTPKVQHKLKAMRRQANLAARVTPRSTDLPST
ncbi:MAG TPA: hypothetical protein VGB55_14740 [Tepidisphaeraceae bacterium]|jgi:acyl-coenzyme A thioesterase PaaI-like protein